MVWARKILVVILYSLRLIKSQGIQDYYGGRSHKKILIEESNLSLKEATKFLCEPASRDQVPTITNHKNIVKAFIE